MKKYKLKYSMAVMFGLPGETLEYAFETLDFALRQRDQYTSVHSNNVTKYSILLGMESHLHYNDIMRLKLLGALHDIGKIGVSDSILNKNGSLTEEERQQIQRHPEIGFNIVIKGREDLKSEMFPILFHHERWDGKGYPRGLHDEQIPLLARIISIVEVYDRVCDRGDYPEAERKRNAVQVIVEGSGTQFDPHLVDVFIRLLQKQATLAAKSTIAID